MSLLQTLPGPQDMRPGGAGAAGCVWSSQGELQYLHTHAAQKHKDGPSRAVSNEGWALAKESLSWEGGRGGEAAIGEGRGLGMGSPAEQVRPSEAHSKDTFQVYGNSSSWKNTIVCLGWKNTIVCLGLNHSD